MDVARLNFSHGSADEHAETARLVRDAAGRAGRQVAILQDLPGPKLRIGKLREGVVEFKPGDRTTFVCGTNGGEGDASRLFITYAGLASTVERDEVIADLADLAVYQALLETRGVRGIVVDCGDCGEQHFHEWSLLRASLQQLLDEGQMRPHEPAFDPDPASYVTWEYCRGYADAVLSDS